MATQHSIGTEAEDTLQVKEAALAERAQRAQQRKLGLPVKPKLGASPEFLESQVTHHASLDCCVTTFSNVPPVITAASLVPLAHAAKTWPYKITSGRQDILASEDAGPSEVHAACCIATDTAKLTCKPVDLLCYVCMLLHIRGSYWFQAGNSSSPQGQGSTKGTAGAASFVHCAVAFVKFPVAD